MKISACLTLSLIFILASSLKIHRPHHDYDNVSTYLQGLIEEQGKFEAGM